MRRRIWGLIVLTLLAALLLTACGVQTEQTIASEERIGDPEQAEAATKTQMMPDLDATALKDTMPEEDYAAFLSYLPVLEGEQTFRWVAGPYDGYPDYDWEPFNTDMAGFHDQIWSVVETDCPPETLTLDRLAVQDVDGDGTAELALLFQDLAYRYLVLHMEGEDCYGTTFGVRWFMGLRENGIYEGSGGAGSSTYYRMAFQDGIFKQQWLGHREEWATGSEYELDGEPVTKETFYTWLAENVTEEVTWYAPDGSVIPENQ